MRPEIETHRSELVQLCRRFAVQRLEIFGSAVRDDFDPARSDVDLLVEFAPNAPKTFAQYFGFKEALEALLGRPVDLLEDHVIKNPYLRAAIERRKEPLYGPAGLPPLPKAPHPAPRRDPRVSLWDALNAAESITRCTSGRIGADYERDAILRSAVERLFQRCSAALNRLDHTAPDLARHISDRRAIVDCSKMLTLGYASVNNAKIWEIIQTKLPALQETLRRLLGDG